MFCNSKEKISWLIDRILNCEFGEKYKFQEVRALIEEAHFTKEELLQFGVNSSLVEQVSSYLNLLQSAYVSYKRDWCDSRGYSYMKTQYNFDKGLEMPSGMFVCKDEFEEYEFQDRPYMKNLLDKASFKLWENFVDTESSIVS